MHPIAAKSQRHAPLLQRCCHPAQETVIVFVLIRLKIEITRDPAQGFIEGVSPKKSLVKIGEPSHTRRFASDRGEFFAKRVAIWIFGSGRMITDPWPTPSAAVKRSAQGQARAAVPPDPLRVVYGHPLTLHGSTPV
jgi:hypothetical protein